MTGVAGGAAMTPTETEQKVIKKQIVKLFCIQNCWVEHLTRESTLIY